MSSENVIEVDGVSKSYLIYDKPEHRRPMHGLYILGIVNIIGPALSLLDIQSELLRERLHGMTVFVSLCAVFYIWVLLNGFDPEGYAGLTQRIFGSINFLWPLVFAWHVPRKIAQPIT